LGGLWALEWSWHSTETNLRCAGISGICVPNPSIVTLIVSEIYILSDESSIPFYSTSNGYNKYNKHPVQISISQAPIPERETEYLHIDIFYAQYLIFISCKDSYCIYLVVKEIPNKLNIENKISDIWQPFP